MSFWVIGSVIGATGVGFGALGAHWIKKHFNDINKSKSWEIAAHYQLFHAVPIMLAGNQSSLKTAGSLLTAGVLLFSGSVYGLVLVKSPKVKKVLGPITPVGGLLLIAGWSCFVYAAGQNMQ